MTKKEIAAARNARKNSHSPRLDVEPNPNNVGFFARNPETPVNSPMLLTWDFAPNHAAPSAHADVRAYTPDARIIPDSSYTCPACGHKRDIRADPPRDTRNATERGNDVETLLCSRCDWTRRGRLANAPATIRVHAWNDKRTFPVCSCGKEMRFRVYTDKKGNAICQGCAEPIYGGKKRLPLPFNPDALNLPD